MAKPHSQQTNRDRITRVKSIAHSYERMLGKRALARTWAKIDNEYAAQLERIANDIEEKLRLKNAI
jgi:hypothetical protein